MQTIYTHSHIKQFILHYIYGMNHSNQITGGVLVVYWLTRLTAES